MFKGNNKQNSNTLNISHETIQKDWKPSIKVGYRMPSLDISAQQISLPVRTCPPKKNIESDRQPAKPCSKRHAPAISNGRFSNSIYEKDGDYEKGSSRGMRAETYRKHHASSLFMRSRREEEMGSRSVSTHRSTLPSYEDNGIKGILQYKHAKPYRNVQLTDKCNNVPVQGRKVTFEQLHQFDFRHRPQRF